jgi:hypothetical protein
MHREKEPHLVARSAYLWVQEKMDTRHLALFKFSAKLFAVTQPRQQHL